MNRMGIASKESFHNSNEMVQWKRWQIVKASCSSMDV